jgi:hypothetical protein
VSKKDYQAIATAIYRARQQHEGMGSEGEDVFKTVEGELADMLSKGNPRFEHFRFFEACTKGRCKGMRQVA